MRRRPALAPRIVIVTQGVICAVAASLLLSGCAIFQPETNARVASSQRPRVALKDGAWRAPVVTPARPAVASRPRSAAPSASLPLRGALANEQGSCGDAEQCALLLRLMVDDPTRRWISERPSPVVYANGTRLFAYLALRAKLTCKELEFALDETQSAASSLNGRIPGLTPGHVAGVRALNSQVEGELRAEHAERCKNDLATSSG